MAVAAAALGAAAKAQAETRSSSFVGIDTDPFAVDIGKHVSAVSKPSGWEAEVLKWDDVLLAEQLKRLSCQPKITAALDPVAAMPQPQIRRRSRPHDDVLDHSLRAALRAKDRAISKGTAWWTQRASTRGDTVGLCTRRGTRQQRQALRERGVLDVTSLAQMFDHRVGLHVSSARAQHVAPGCIASTAV